MTTSDGHRPVSQTRCRAGLSDYLRIARFDHATKHVFVIPGIALALLLRGSQSDVMGNVLIFNMIMGFAAAISIASANYVINEWLDRDFDKYHPSKSQRAAVQNEMSGTLVLSEYVAFLLLGLVLAGQVNTTFLWISALFLISGITYNVAPVRTKDKAYLDVLTESLNNPIRLLLGWAMVDPSTIPPGSLLMSFWFGGAFLMNSKRLSEYRDIVASYGRETLGRYRQSFRHYTENRLSVANLVYALLCSFFIAIFLVKYRIEYILLFPCIVAMFAVYYALTLTPNSVARNPEKLYRAKPVLVSVIVTTLVFVFATLVDIPWFDNLTNQTFIEIRVSKLP